MKTLITSGLIFLLTVSFVVCTELHTVKTLDTIIKLTEELPDTPDGGALPKLEAIEKEWSNNKALYSALIKYDYLYGFTKELSSAKSGVYAGDNGTYLSSKRSMLITLRYIRNLQKPRLINML